jgi:hypothetical protein
VIGVTGHKGDVLPVLDLAMVFGRRSLETADWSMVLVKNGDFRAFVITEHVYDERMLPRDVQRKVPIILPHNLVYGCYPEGAVVRLILNVEALAVHFDKAMVKELLTALTREMAEAPAELVPSLLPEEHRPMEPRKEEEEPAVAAAAEASMKAAVEAEARAKSESEERARREAEERTRQEAAERERVEAEIKVRAETEARIRREAEERAREEAEAQAKAAEEEKARLEAGERARSEAEARAAAEVEAKARREEEDRARREAGEKARRDAEEQARHLAEERARIAAEEKARRQAEEEAGRRAAEKARAGEEERSRIAAEEERRRDAAAALRETEAIKRTAIEETIPASAATFSSRTASAPSGAPAPESGKRLERGSKEWRTYIAYGIAAIVLSLLVYFGLFKTAEERGGEGKASLTAEAGKKAETPAASRKKPEREGPLVLTVPEDRKIEADMYIVKQGDTLWDICERFTGDPFNYPRVAGDNRIANPDLIFPGQNIYLRK